MRRSGPCDFEKLRTCTTRSGSHVPSVTSPSVEMSPEWSSSITTRSSTSDAERMTRASSAARAGVIDAPVGFWARGCSSTATGRRCSARASASGTMPSSSSRTGTASAPSTSSRSRKGGNPGLSTTTRSPKRTSCPSVREIASRAPSTTMIDSAVDGHDAASTVASAGITGSAW